MQSPSYDATSAKQHNTITALTMQFPKREMNLKSVTLQESEGSATAEGGEKLILFLFF